MKTKVEIYRLAREAFDDLIEPTRILNKLQLLQLELNRWANTSLPGKHDKVSNTLGIGEELGELAGPLALLVAAQMGKTQHAMLKNIQGISEHESQASDGEIKGWPARSPGNTHSEAPLLGRAAIILTT